MSLNEVIDNDDELLAVVASFLRDTYGEVWEQEGDYHVPAQQLLLKIEERLEELMGSEEDDEEGDDDEQ